MTKRLKVSDTLTIPVDIVTDTNAILAKKGAGKSYCGSVLAEEMIAAGQRIVAIDPTDAWWGLRAKADGSPNGLPVIIFGGDHADLPLDENMGSVVADLIVDQKVASCILCTKGFESDASRVRFLTQLGARLFFRNREPLHLFLDEADDYLPQYVTGELAKLVNVWTKIVKQGRKQGLGVTLISQRAAVVNKSVLTQISTLIVLQTIGPQDVKAISEWVRAKGSSYDEMLDSLPRLKKGEAWVYSPEFLEIDPPQRFQVRLRRTFNSGATPKVGERVIEPKELAKVDLEALRESLASTIAKAQADDPKTLRATIRQLEQQIAKQARTPDRVEIEVPVVERVEIKVPVLEKHHELALENVQRALEDAAKTFDWLVAAVKAAAPPPSHPPQPMRPARSLPTAILPSPKATTSTPGSKHLRSGAIEMLRALVALGGTLTRKQLATMVGIKPTGSTFATYLSDIRSAGYAIVNGNEVTITDAGRRNTSGEPTSDIRALWNSKLRAGAACMLQELLAAYPKPMSREVLAQKSSIDPSGSTFATYMSDLVSNGLAVKVGRDLLAADVFFIGGRR